jgi:DNA polymerase I-like protein with 3'-5' exonuclease and polymerase domains
MASTQRGTCGGFTQSMCAYGEYDALAPHLIFERQLKILESEDLLDIFEIESRLVPLLWQMRLRGVRVDLEAAELLTGELLQMEDALRLNFRQKYNSDIDEWSAPQIAALCDELRLQYPRTPKGNPSFTGDWLDQHPEPLFKSLAELREINRLRTTFVKDWIFDNQIKGVIHPQWKQLKSDEGGTKTGRMAAANPNPQQIPSRADLAPRIRALFVPLDPKDRWAKIDYSQQEPRILVHYASKCKCTGADIIKMAYQRDKGMDIYKFLGEAAHVSRKEAKDITLGRCYGMGVNKLAAKLGIGRDQAEKLLRGFDSQVPFVREMSESAMKRAQARGWIRTLGGRKRHFNLWEPSDSYQRKQNGERIIPCRRVAAEARWPRSGLQRAEVHKALNSLIQGSAADMTKICMLKIYDEYGKVPFLQVHDELDYGVDTMAEAQKLQHTAETCVDMVVPIKADLDVGDHWK